MTAPTPRPGILDIAPYVGGKSSSAGAARVIKLSSNEGALGPSPRAIEALQKSATKLHRYPDGGCDLLRAKLAEKYDLEFDQIVCGAGSDELITLLIRAYAGPGDEVLYSQHGFLMYPIAAKGVGAVPVTAAETNMTASVDSILAAVTDKTKIVFVANPNNPTGTYITSAEVARLREGLREDILLVVDAAYAEFMTGQEDYTAGAELVAKGDNTVMTPLLLRPIEHGVDIVVYSTTKFIGGHGVHVGGVLIDSAKFPWAQDSARWPELCGPSPSYHGAVFEEALRPLGNISYIMHVRTHWLRDTGAAMSPFAAFLTLQGLETLHLRMQRHCENALKVAEFLEGHDAVEWVNYPGLPSHSHHESATRYLPDGAGALLGFGIKGGEDAGKKFIESVKLASHLANIGDAKTLVIHPASTTHSQLTAEEQASAGVSPEYVRISVGIEDASDIIADLDQALRASR